MKPAVSRDRVVIIGLAGGSGSGKTMVAQQLARKIGEDRVLCLGHDSYYKCLSHLSDQERMEWNFDHPDALDNQLLVKHLGQLTQKQTVEKPVYDFATHTRKHKGETVLPRDLIILEGVLLLCDRRLREMMDVRVFIEADPDIRFIRRTQRDINERGRSLASIINQYLQTVRTMHREYVEPSKRSAHLVIDGNGAIDTVVDQVLEGVRRVLGDQRGSSQIGNSPRHGTRSES